MSTSTEHQDYQEALGAYALGALPEAEADRLAAHLETCRECRDELGSLRAAVDVLPASVAPTQPPPGLKERLMETVNAEAALLRAAGEAADRPLPPASRPRRRLSGPRIPVAAGFAVACLVGIVIALVVTASGTRTVPVRITAAARFMHTRARLTITGDHAELSVTNLPVPAAGHVEELWVERGSRAPVPAGTFVLATGTVAVSGPVRSGDLVLMTIEPGRGTAHPTTPPLLVARV